MKILAVAAALAALSGCAGISDVVQKREALYQAAPIHPPTLHPSADAYNKAMAAAQAAYAPLTDGSALSMVDAGIGSANANCRAWLAAVSAAEQRWRQGEQNVGVLASLITGILGATNVHHDMITAWGLGSAAWQGYSQGFLSNVLGMSDYNLQTKVREAMATRAAELRAQAASLSYPQAVDAIEEYAMLCTPQAAKALSTSALTAVTATVAPTGAITVAPITSTFLKDDSGERIVAWWMPGNVVNQAHQDQIRAWMDGHGAAVSIAFFANSKTYESARKQMVSDLQLPEISK
jgi:uncharacterized membrane protein YeaQ/YmgE (transglycosylase-associated protein family)